MCSSDLLTRAAAADIAGISVPLIHLDDLLIAKILAGRPKDIEDARTLWRLHGPRVDRRRIRRLLRLLEEALGQSDLLSAFEAVAAESRRT